MSWIWIVVVVILAFIFLRRGGMAPPETVAALLKLNPKIIDVRTTEEFRDGHLDAAIHIPLADLVRKIGQQAPDKGQPLLLHCRSGARSGAGKKLLEQQGYTNVHNLGSLARARALLKE